MNFLWFKIIYKSHLIDTHWGIFLQTLLFISSLILLLTGDIHYNISVFWNLVHLFVNPAYNLASYPKYDLCYLSEVGSIHPSQTVPPSGHLQGRGGQTQGCLLRLSCPPQDSQVLHSMLSETRKHPLICLVQFYDCSWWKG